MDEKSMTRDFCFLVTLATVAFAASASDVIMDNFRRDVTSSAPAFHTRRTANSRQCYVLCIRTSACQALSFHLHQCRLYDKRAGKGTTTLVNSSGAVYAEMETAANQALELRDGCHDSACPEGFACVQRQQSAHEKACLPLVFCGQPKTIQRGKVTLTSIFVTSQATYSCDVNHTFVGTDPVVTCRLDGQWSNLPGQCVANCGTPGELLHATANFTGTLLDSLVTYVCDVGYVFSGVSNTSRCRDNSMWIGLEGSCQLVDCGPPANLTVGHYEVKATTFRAEAQYQCGQTHAFVGNKSNSTCNADGTWSQLQGDCVPDCGSPHPLENATALYNSTLEGAVAQYACADGFNFYGCDNTSLCGQGSNWTRPSGQCMPATECPPGFSLNATLGFCVKYVSTLQNWQTAREACRSCRPSADLAIPDSFEKLDFLRQIYKAEVGPDWTAKEHYAAENCAFIGATDLESEGNFTWVNGNEMPNGAQNGWMPGEPNNGGGEEDCASLAMSDFILRHNDLHCDTKSRSFCQIFL